MKIGYLYQIGPLLILQDFFILFYFLFIFSFLLMTKGGEKIKYLNVRPNTEAKEPSLFLCNIILILKKYTLNC